MPHFAIYGPDGDVRRKLIGSREAAEIGLADDETVYEGQIDPAKTYLPGGVPTSKQAAPEIVTAADVKAFAGRILSYTDWVDIRSINGPDPSPEMTAYRQAVRDRSGVIEAMTPIPADYRDPKHWPVAP